MPRPIAPHGKRLVSPILVLAAVASGCASRVSFATFGYRDDGPSRRVIVALENDNKLRWQTEFATVSDEDVITTGAVAVDARGDVVFTTIFRGAITVGDARIRAAGDIDCLVGKLARVDGTVVWLRHLSGTGKSINHCRAIAVDRRNDLVIAGYFPGVGRAEPFDLGTGALVSAGSNDIFVAKLSGQDGRTRWVRQFGGVGNDMARTVALDGDDAIVMGGSFGGEVSQTDGTMRIGNVALSTVGGFDFFVAKLASDGTPQWAQSFGGPGFDYVADLLIAPDRSIFVAAEIADGGVLHATALRLSPDGGKQWQRNLGNPASVPRAISLTPPRSVTVEIAHLPANDKVRVTLSANGDLQPRN